MSPIHATGSNPEITQIPTYEGTSAVAVTPHSSHAERAAAANSSPTESSDFLKSYANDNASEFRAPGASTSTRSPEAAAAGPSQKTTIPESDDFNGWLGSSKMQTKYDKLDDAQKQKVKQTHQEVSEGLNRVSSEAKTLPNGVRGEVETHAKYANTEFNKGNLKNAQEHLGYANDALGRTKQAGSGEVGRNAEVRKWPEKSNAVYPHKGKHKPGFDTTNKPDSMINKQIMKESSNGNAAKYNTSNAANVHKLEAEAYENGYETKHANGTAVHKYDKNIGASEGELTPYIRLDGTDHGHPITQNQFDKYIQKEADHLKKTGDDTTELSNYLNKIGENPQSFGITS
jgi:hypothetical protein